MLSPFAPHMVEEMWEQTGFAAKTGKMAMQNDWPKYDEAKMQADIDRYGLYSYDEFSDYLSEMQFDMFNGKYFKVLVGKGVFTREDIMDIIRNNL